MQSVELFQKNKCCKKNNNKKSLDEFQLIPRHVWCKTQMLVRTQAVTVHKNWEEQVSAASQQIKGGKTDWFTNEK